MRKFSFVFSKRICEILHFFAKINKAKTKRKIPEICQQKYFRKHLFAKLHSRNFVIFDEFSQKFCILLCIGMKKDEFLSYYNEMQFLLPICHFFVVTNLSLPNCHFCELTKLSLSNCHYQIVTLPNCCYQIVITKLALPKIRPSFKLFL